jgi:hypothetical protein
MGQSCVYCNACREGEPSSLSMLGAYCSLHFHMGECLCHGRQATFHPDRSIGTRHVYGSYAWGNSARKGLQCRSQRSPPTSLARLPNQITASSAVVTLVDAQNGSLPCQVHAPLVTHRSYPAFCPSRGLVGLSYTTTSCTSITTVILCLGARLSEGYVVDAMPRKIQLPSKLYEAMCNSYNSRLMVQVKRIKAGWCTYAEG